MMVENIKKRKRRILKAIIQQHILTAEPVGSRTLAKKYELEVSPATIRNEMSDLEEMGFLEQPHTSAGRIPSDMGYRFYVDALMEKEGVRSKELEKSLHELYDEKQGIQGVISGMAQMLSKLTRYAAMISEPQLGKSKIRKLQLLRVAQKSLLIVLITDTGIVNNKIIKLRQDLSPKQIKYINQFLIKRLQNKELAALDNYFMKKIERELMKKINLSKEIFDLLENELNQIIAPADLQIYLGGTSYILDQPEFNDMETLKEVLNILDQKETLRKLITNVAPEGVEVKIGQENQLEEMQKCSVVFTTYSLGNRAIGKIGVIGPTRMEYPRVISTVNFVSKVLGEIISEVSR